MTYWGINASVFLHRSCLEVMVEWSLILLLMALEWEVPAWKVDAALSLGQV